jgi:hypothetical protein
MARWISYTDDDTIGQDGDWVEDEEQRGDIVGRLAAMWPPEDEDEQEELEELAAGYVSVDLDALPTLDDLGWQSVACAWRLARGNGWTSDEPAPKSCRAVRPTWSSPPANPTNHWSGCSLPLAPASGTGSRRSARSSRDKWR